MADIQEDGLGQSFFTDVRWWLGFWRRSRVTALWELPDDAARSAWAEHPRLERFADWLYASVVRAPERWLVAERAWFGWPDPPRFIFVAFDAGGEIRCVHDFNHWPARWRVPEGADL